ncbi:MAG: YafY family transcriptional regulator [Rhodothermales bacterium]|nr:YafY family transcriptional regulator [Rhodothermales bacterium]
MSNAEKRKKKTDRLFEIVILLQARPNLTSKDLAEHFGVTRRTIFRDLRSLSESGVPLTYGEDTGYEILEGYQLPPLMITAREAATLLVGLGFMKLQTDPTLQAEAEAVEVKIMNVLPQETRSFVSRLKDRTVLDPYWSSALKVDRESDGWWHKITEAVTTRNSLIIDYYVESRDEVTRRTVDPLGLVYYTDHWNLIAFDHLRGTIRNFRLDRIRKLHVSMSRFEAPEDFDLQDHVDRSQMSDEIHQVVIRFKQTVASTAVRVLPARIDNMDAHDAYVDIAFRFDNLHYLSNWLRRFGTDAEVIEPAELKGLVAEEARKVQDLYS